MLTIFIRNRRRLLHRRCVCYPKYDHLPPTVLTTHVYLPGGFFLLFGLILLFDRALLAMGDILFLVGITLLLGPQRTFLFFARRQKWRGMLPLSFPAKRSLILFFYLLGSAAFWSGILLILLRWPFVGFVVQCYGMFILFGEFFKTIADFAYGIPVVGPYVARALSVAGDKAGADDRAHKDLPV